MFNVGAELIGELLDGREGDVNAVVIGSLGSRDVIVSGGDDATIRLWDQHGTPIGEPPQYVVVSGNSGGDIAVWNRRGQLVDATWLHWRFGWGSGINALAVGRLLGQQVVVSGASDGTIVFYDSALQPILEPLASDDEPIVAVAIGRPGGREVVAAALDLVDPPTDLALNGNGRLYASTTNGVCAWQFK